MANLENEAAQGLLALENSSTPHLHSAQRASQRAAQSTLLAQEAARRGALVRQAVQGRCRQGPHRGRQSLVHLSAAVGAQAAQQTAPARRAGAGRVIPCPV